MSNAQIAYEYTRKAYDSFIQARSQFFERVHKILLATVILFSALSYGATQMLAVRGVSAGLLWAAEISGAVAAALLAVSFLCTLRLLQFQPLALPAVNRLANAAQNPEFHQWNENQIWVSLALNTRSALVALIDQNARTSAWCQWLNRSLVAGYTLSAAFLALVVCARVGYLAQIPGGAEIALSTHQEHAMPNDEQTGQANVNPQSDPAGSSEPASTQPGAPTPASSPADLVEDPTIVVLGQEAARVRAGGKRATGH